jgi:hypothetical protein
MTNFVYCSLRLALTLKVAISLLHANDTTVNMGTVQVEASTRHNQ